MSDRLLVLVRHGQSDWNLKNLFTGWRDVDLSPKGVEEARDAGRKLKAQGLQFDVAYTSALIRAQRTLDLMLAELGQTGIPVTKDQALNERDYGDLSGLNKDDARKKWGEEQVHIWRRSYDVAPPGGESLRDTAARVLPYYVQEILPAVLRGQRVLVAAARQFVARAGDGAGSAFAGRHCQARDRHRRADDLPAERGLDRGVEAGSGGVTYVVATGASQPSMARLRAKPLIIDISSQPTMPSAAHASGILKHVRGPAQDSLTVSR